jgi:hypothetical protein
MPSGLRECVVPGTFADSTEVSIEISQNGVGCGEGSDGVDILKLRPSSILFKNPLTVFFHYEASSQNTVYIQKYSENLQTWNTVEIR